MTPQLGGLSSCSHPPPERLIGLLRVRKFPIGGLRLSLLDFERPTGLFESA
jgi:hypothetical protein